MDQCACFGSINIIPGDVEKRYKFNLIEFVPSLYESYDDAISNCSPRNQALVWLASDNNAEFDLPERQQRYLLATTYAALTGAQWKKQESWLSSADSCDWGGVDCSGGIATALDLSGNNAKGSVSFSFILRLNDWLFGSSSSQSLFSFYRFQDKLPLSSLWRQLT